MKNVFNFFSEIKSSDLMIISAVIIILIFVVFRTMLFNKNKEKFNEDLENYEDYNQENYEDLETYEDYNQENYEDLENYDDYNQENYEDLETYDDYNQENYEDYNQENYEDLETYDDYNQENYRNVGRKTNSEIKVPSQDSIKDAINKLSTLYDNYDDIKIALDSYKLIERNRNPLKSKRSQKTNIDSIQKDNKQIERDLQNFEANVKNQLYIANDAINALQNIYNSNKNDSNLAKLEEAKKNRKNLENLYNKVYDNKTRTVKIESDFSSLDKNSLIDLINKKIKYYNDNGNRVKVQMFGELLKDMKRIKEQPMVDASQFIFKKPKVSLENVITGKKNMSPAAFRPLSPVRTTVVAPKPSEINMMNANKKQMRRSILNIKNEINSKYKNIENNYKDVVKNNNMINDLNKSLSIPNNKNRIAIENQARIVENNNNAIKSKIEFDRKTIDSLNTLNSVFKNKINQ